jgi:hypothetical protein
MPLRALRQIETIAHDVNGAALAAIRSMLSPTERQRAPRWTAL